MIELIDGESEGEIERKADVIMEVAEDVKRYGVFKSAKNLGIVFGPSDLSFADFLLFRHIEEMRGK